MRYPTEAENCDICEVFHNPYRNGSFCEDCETRNRKGTCRSCCPTDPLYIIKARFYTQLAAKILDNRDCKLCGRKAE